MMAREGGRLLMLGTPNGGSWAPMQTLSGDDNFGNALVAFGSLFDNGGTRKMMAAMPGFIQLQAALLDPNLGLDKATTWQKLADDDMAALRDRSLWHDEGSQRTIYEWGAPPQDVLDQAVKLRRRLDAQADALGADAQKMLLVVGHAAFTPAGFTQTSDGLEYLDTPDDGDGRVPLQSALLPGVRTWKVDAEHGKLPDEASAFAAYIELLTTGETRQLDPYVPAAPGTRGTGGAAAATAALVRSRPSRGLQSSSPPASEAEVLGAARGGAEARRGRGKSTALRVSVLNGDLKFVGQPLMVGHYRSIALTGTEWVVDGLVGHAMSKSLAAGLYPDATGSHQIFGNVRKDPNNPFVMARPQAVVVAGLGDEGKLRASELVYTVRQAVLAYAQRVAEQGGAAQFELAATLIGSGGKGISPGSAAQLIAQGAFEASQKLQQGDWPQLGRLIFVEFYLDRASEAWRSLQVQAIATPNQLELVGLVTSGDGALRRSLDSSYRGAAYDLISALSVAGKNGQPCIEYVLDTRRARTEVRAVHAQGTLLRELVAKASNDENRDSQIGRTLFKLLVPVEMEPFLGGTTEMLIELDSGSAVIPWELLDTDAPAQSGGDARPWAIRSKLLRKLRTNEFRAQVSDANADDSVLVIGEPKCDNPNYPPLPGARAEAIAVVNELTSGADGIPAAKLRSLVSGEDDARSVINALFERPYRVVHVAGHGELGVNGGVVLSGNTFLGAAEIKAMRVVPELVFLNCCHLAGRDASTTLKPYDRATFAANIAEALIEVGVRCVIAAGWAVEDGPAEKFATTFYSVLLRGERFIDAVAAAREAAWRDNPQGNTWAAYQCYGDPGWTWSRGGADAQRPAPPVGDEFIGVSSPVALALALETLAIRSRFSNVRVEVQRDKLRFLESKFAAEWGGMGAVAEAFGLAYGQAKDSAKAIEWYRVAVNSADGSASFRAAEQLGNELARCGEKLKDETAARRMIEEGIDQLGKLVALQATVERESLLGSAWKRLVLLETRAGFDAASLKALEKMVVHYANAETLACKSKADNLYYPAKNGISAELRLAFLQKRAPKLTEARLSAVRESLDKAATERPDFWSVVGQTELAMLEALAQGRLAGSAPALMDAARELKARVPGTSSWDSVYTEARFTLEPYQAVASAAEQRAAAEILKGLKVLASS
jgi:CHAT domain-containing protein